MLYVGSRKKAMFYATEPIIQLEDKNAQLHLLIEAKASKVVLTECCLQSIIEVHKFVCSKTQLCQK